MAYIETIHETEATGDVAQWYKRVGNPDGSVDNVMKIHSRNLETLRTHFEMYVQVMHKPSPLTHAEREMVGVVVSRINGCGYCLHHHHSGLLRRLSDDRVNAANALRAGEPAELSEREAEMLAFATKLTMSPGVMSEDDVQALREVGLDDHAILDLAQCIGYFNYVNRMVTGLGVQLGEGEGGAGLWPE